MDASTIVYLFILAGSLLGIGGAVLYNTIQYRKADKRMKTKEFWE